MVADLFTQFKALYEQRKNEAELKVMLGQERAFWRKVMMQEADKESEMGKRAPGPPPAPVVVMDVGEMPAGKAYSVVYKDADGTWIQEPITTSPGGITIYDGDASAGEVIPVIIGPASQPPSPPSNTGEGTPGWDHMLRERFSDLDLEPEPGK